MKLSVTFTFEAEDFDDGQVAVNAAAAALAETGAVNVKAGALIDRIAAQKDSIKVFTDGGCDAKKGLGAYAFVIEYPDGVVARGVQPYVNTTNNRMEMMAVIKALEEIEIGRPIVLTTDSEYVIKGTTMWARNWVRNGWRTREGKVVLNRDLWERLLALYQVHECTFEHVRGHTGHEQNEWCDSACTAAMQTANKLILANTQLDEVLVDQVPN